MEVAVAEAKAAIDDFNKSIDAGVNDFLQWFNQHVVPLPQSVSFATGDAVSVWSQSKNRWMEDGIVQELSAVDRHLGGTLIPAGSVKVSFRSGLPSKWILPYQLRDCLRKLASARSVATGSTSSGRAFAPLAQAIPMVGTDVKGMLETLRTVEQRCQQERRQFVDPDFSTSTTGRVTAWLRPQEIARHDGKALQPQSSGIALDWSFFSAAPSPQRPSQRVDWQLFRDTPRADDVQQGELGDCWFLSSLAVLAEYQGGRFVRDLLPGQSKLSKDGVYLVRLCLGGSWQGILVDDRLPCIGGGKYFSQIAYCVTLRLQLWASLIEKAFAKACGSYEALVGGEASEALSMFTGWPCTMIIFERRDFDPDVLWATLCSARDADFLMTCSTKEAKSSSLVPFHVYSLMNVFEVTVPSVGMKRLVKIRNPHFKLKWQGNWSDTSSLWTPELRRQCDCPAGGNPGVFFMELGDFLQHFAHCTICRIRSEWHEDRAPFRLPSMDTPCEALELQAFETTECSASLVQKEERLQTGPYACDMKLPLGCIGFTVLRTDAAGDARAVETASLRCRGTSSADFWLQRGSYLLVPLSRHVGSELRVTCSVVSSRKVTLRERRLDRSVIRTAWASYARNNDPSHVTFHGAELYIGRAEGGSIVAYAENLGTGYFYVELSLTSDGLHFSRGKSVTCDWLPPGCGQIIQFAQPSNSGGSASWTSKHRFKIAVKCPNETMHNPGIRGGESDLHAPFLVGSAAPVQPANASCAPQ